MSDSERILELAARELAGPCRYVIASEDCKCVNCDLFNATTTMLKRRLLPLLEAGQVMRRRIILDAKSIVVPDIEPWDAAKAAALKED